MRVKPFLKSAVHQHKDPQVRLTHVETLDPGDESSAEVLAALATGDEDVSVRLAAIARVRDLAVLRGLLDAGGDANATDEAASEAAEKRLGRMFEEGEVSDVAVRALLDTHAARLAPLVASASPVAAQRERALDALDDEHALVGVIQGSRLHDARLAAAERLTRHDTMRAALAACRSRDKVVAKLLQQRLDAEAAAEATRIATRHAVTSTLESMRALGTSVWSPQTAGRAKALRERWDAFGSEDTAADAEAFAEADARVRSVIDDHAGAADADATGSGADTTSAPDGAAADGGGDAAPADGRATSAASTGGGHGDSPGAASGETGNAKARAPTAPSGPPADETGTALAAALSDVGIDALLATIDGPQADASGDDVPGTDTSSGDAPDGDVPGDAVPSDEGSDDGRPDEDAPRGAVSSGAVPGEGSGDEPGDGLPDGDVDGMADGAHVAAGPVGEGEERGSDAGGSRGATPVLPTASSPSSDALRAHARAVAVLFDPPFDHQKARPGALAQRLRRVEALLDTGSLLPGLELDSHRYVRELAAHRDTLTERLSRSKQESSDRIKATHRQFAALGGIIGEGKWTPANVLFKRLQKKLAAMEPAERAGLDEKMARAEKQLAEMGDWQDFAARPKLEALCAEMEALPARELVPDQLARAVRDLQSQWKELGPSRAANELWPRFKAAGDTAYEPCKAWFAAKGEERKAKSDARRAICEALEADVDMLGNALVIDPADAAKPRRRRRRSKGARQDGDAGTPAGTAAETSGATPDTAAEGTAPDTGGANAGDGATADGTTPPASDVSADGAAADGPPTGSGDAGADPAADTTAAAEQASAADTSTDGGDGEDAGTGAGGPAAAGADGAVTGEGPDGEPAPKPEPIVVNPDGPEPDWKAVQRRVSDAKREWSANRVTDRKPDRSLEGRFSAALKPYERALATRYKANEEEKKALIEKAEALASGEITQHVANQAKTLLSAWKLVGMVPRRVDQALWERFNGHLGTIFKHQQAVVREKRRAGFEHVDRAKAISRELRALAKGDSVDEAVVQKLADEFNALPDFPERDRRGLERDFRASLDATGRVQETAGKRRKQAEAEERARLVGLCERLENAVEAPDEVADADTLREDVGHAWEASETRVAREMATRLEARRDAALAHLAAGTTPDFAANEEARRDLLIRMEVAADVETPAEDKSRRMRYQLENLQSGMTSAGVADRRATLAAFEEEWLVAPPASRTVRDALHSRYLRAMGR